MSDSKPEDAPEHCPGTASAAAGSASACEGCPNQRICASGAPAAPDPDAGRIAARLSHIRHTVLVLSGKGGVGKSTVAATVARCLAAQGAMVGVLDVDLHGPSQARLFGVAGHGVHAHGGGWEPVWVEDNLAVMSTSFLLKGEEDAVIWRGPSKNGLIKQFLHGVEWGELDYLVVDTPPGTSDEHLTLMSYLKTGAAAVVVTTPQEVALLDVRKELTFCAKVKLPVIGLVENMTSFVCPSCQFESVLFPPSTGGATALGAEHGISVLGRLPIDGRVARCCDEGKSFLEEHPDSTAAMEYGRLAGAIREYFADKSKT